MHRGTAFELKELTILWVSNCRAGCASLLAAPCLPHKKTRDITSDDVKSGREHGSRGACIDDTALYAAMGGDAVT